MKIEVYPYRSNPVPVTRKFSYYKNVSEDQLNYIHEQYTSLLSENDIETIISNILTKILQLLSSNNITLLLYEDNNITFKKVIGTELNPDIFECKKYIKEHKILISNDVSTDPRIIESDLSTLCCIPINVYSAVIGIVMISGSPKYLIKKISQIRILIDFISNIIHLTHLIYPDNIFEIHHKCNSKRSGLDILVKKEVGDFKDMFITTISHEIRTPLNGIVGMTRLLQDSEGLSEKQYNYIRILSECSTQLMELINDILDLTRMNSGHLPLNNAQFDLQECIQSSIDIVCSKAIEKGIELKVNNPRRNSSTVLKDSIDTPRPYQHCIPSTMLYGDSRRLKQVLINLLNNAIKFTDSGSIVLSVEIDTVDDDNSDKKNIQFSIKDTGVGIPKKYHEKIFEIFSKIYMGNPQTPGTGLGLSISKKLIELMGGTISVESDGVPGNGTIFTFNVIMDYPVHKEGVEASVLDGKTVLVVDDNEDNRVYLTEILGEWNMNVHCFSSAREMLGYLKTPTSLRTTSNISPRRKSFDLAIIDICMPHMSGVDLMQTLKEKGFQQPLIGLSSVGDAINGKELFDSFCIKPVSKSKLFEMVMKVLNPAGLRKKSSTRDHPITFANKRKSTTEGKIKKSDVRIIIAEDDYYNKIVLQEILKSMGYTNLTTVDNGEICVNTVKNMKFDICLMDVKMPIMDGLEASRIIKQYQNAPIVVGVSASVLEADKDKCFKAGMDGYIPKPIQKEKLESLLTTIVNKLN